VLFRGEVAIAVLFGRKARSHLVLVLTEPLKWIVLVGRRSLFLDDLVYVHQTLSYFRGIGLASSLFKRWEPVEILVIRHHL